MKLIFKLILKAPPQKHAKVLRSIRTMTPVATLIISTLINSVISNPSWAAPSSAQKNPPQAINSESKKVIPPIKIVLLGIPENMKPQILKELSLTGAKIDPKLPEKTSYQHIQMLYQQSLSEIHEALKPIGYYNAEISGKLSRDNVATYSIHLGTPIIVNKVDIKILGEGKDDPTLTSLVAHSGLVSGTILIHDNFKRLKENLLNAANQMGYFDAKFTQSQIQLELIKNQARILLYFDTGIRYHFGLVTFDQASLHEAKMAKATLDEKDQKNSKEIKEPYLFKNSFLQGFVPFDRGEYYQASEYNLLQSQLSDSGYFKNVYLTTSQDSKNHLLDITAKTEPLPAYEYIIGPGYGTDTGPRILAGFKARHITESGQKFSALTQLSSAYRNFTADYIIPGLHPVTDHLNLQVGQNYTDISAYYARDTFLGATWTTTHGNATRSFSLTRHFVIFTPQNQASGYGAYLIPSANYSYINETQDGYFKKGLLVSGNLEGAATLFFSDTSFIQGLINGKFSLPLSNANRLLFSGQMGATKASNFEELPTTFRFYAGGLDSVLGYSYQSLSPHNGQGLTGGKDLLTSSVSFEQHLFNKLSGMVFFNLGNAFNDFDDMQLQKAVGVGLSYRAITGPITIYIAKPVESNIQNGWAFNFSMGWYL
jgi:translocation and assembly module TamA